MSEASSAAVSRPPEAEPRRSREPAASSRQYLFAIVYASDARPCTCPGMDGGEVSTISEGRLAAVVSGVAADKIRPERRYLARHQEVLKQLLAATTPLPVSFGMLAGHPQAIQKILRRNQRMFLEQLERVAGKVEMGLRVTWDVPNIFEYFVNTNPELRAARDRLVGGNRPPTQEEKIELGRMFDRLLTEDRENHTERVQQQLARCCFDVKANACHSEREVMNLACLVGRQGQESFGDAVFRVAQGFDNNFAFDYNGPWAPHNFVEVTL